MGKSSKIILLLNISNMKTEKLVTSLLVSGFLMPIVLLVDSIVNYALMQLGIILVTITTVAVSIIWAYILIKTLNSDVRGFDKGFTAPEKAALYTLGGTVGFFFWYNYLIDIKVGTTKIGADALISTLFSIIIILIGCIVGYWYENRSGPRFF